MSKATKKLFTALFLFITYFFIQVFVTQSELLLTALILIYSGVVLFADSEKYEKYLYLVGLSLGFFIELVLGLFTRQQYWTGANYLDIPLWLPLAWGIGFVAISRLGEYLKIKIKKS